MQAYSPPVSLWRLVEQHVCPNEQEEVKSMLGLSLVEQSLDLHGEVEMLLDIWRDMREEEEDQLSLMRALPEPPNQRERLVQEICFFVESVKEKAKQKGVDPAHFLRQHNSSVLEYAKEQSRPGSSAGFSSRSSDGRETPMMIMSPDRFGASYELADEIESVNEKLNYLDFNTVCENLRKSLVDEVTQLLEDIQFLQGCLDSQADVRDCITPRAVSREPTLTELREERSHLEKELLSSDAIVHTQSVNRPTFNASHRVLPSTPPSPKPTKVINSSGRATPLKAVHTISAQNMRHHSPTSSAMGDPGTQQMDLVEKVSSHANILTLPNSPGLRSKPEKNQSSRQSTGAKISKSDGDVASASSFNTDKTVPLVSSSSVKPVPSPPSMSRPEGVARVPVRRRTASPGRVRVVDVTNIVESQIGKTCVMTSPGVQPIPVTSAATSDLDEHIVSPHDSSMLRPSSANRFRKMVLGCRDGE